MKRVAVVTGAAGGLGRAITARLLADGFAVVGFDLDASRSGRNGGTTGLRVWRVDLTDACAIGDAFDQIATTYGGVDALVNNAGTCFMSEFPDIPADEFDAQMDLNFGGAFHCCQAAIKFDAGSRWGPQNCEYFLQRGV